MVRDRGSRSAAADENGEMSHLETRRPMRNAGRRPLRGRRSWPCTITFARARPCAWASAIVAASSLSACSSGTDGDGGAPMALADQGTVEAGDPGEAPDDGSDAEPLPPAPEPAAPSAANAEPEAPTPSPPVTSESTNDVPVVEGGGEVAEPSPPTDAEPVSPVDPEDGASQPEPEPAAPAQDPTSRENQRALAELRRQVLLWSCVPFLNTTDAELGLLTGSNDNFTYGRYRLDPGLFYADNEGRQGEPRPRATEPGLRLHGQARGLRRTEPAVRVRARGPRPAEAFRAEGGGDSGRRDRLGLRLAAVGDPGRGAGG